MVAARALKTEAVVSVAIAGEDFRLVCSPDDREEMLATAAELDEALSALVRHHPDVDGKARAVMAAIEATSRARAADARVRRLEARIALLERDRAARALNADDEGLIAALDNASATVERLAAELTQDLAQAARRTGLRPPTGD